MILGTWDFVSGLAWTDMSYCWVACLQLYGGLVLESSSG